MAGRSAWSFLRVLLYTSVDYNCFFGTAWKRIPETLNAVSATNRTAEECKGKLKDMKSK